MITPGPDAFTVQRAEVRDGLQLAFLREGVGGFPLVLVHGYPETKRIWWRNVAPLAAAGYEVIVPDLRGCGDSDLSPDDTYDLVHYARDLHALVHDVLGHSHCGLIAGDVGGPVIVDMALRFPDFVRRMIFFNTIPPTVVNEPERYEEAGLSLNALQDDPIASGDYRERQGRDPNGLLAELDTPKRRRRYISEMFGHRLWTVPGAFTQDEVDFMTEPFADPMRLAASWAPYQLAHGRPMSELPMLFQEVPTPTMILYGPEDPVVPADFMARCEIAFPNRTGPLVVPGSGHFLQWERADVLNALAIDYFHRCQSARAATLGKGL